MARAVSASLLAIGLAVGGAPAAQASDLRILQTGENFQVDYGPVPNNVVGGGAVTMRGAGESAEYVHGAGAPNQQGRMATFVGGGENATILYTEPTAPAPLPTRAARPWTNR